MKQNLMIAGSIIIGSILVFLSLYFEGQNSETNPSNNHVHEVERKVNYPKNKLYTGFGQSHQDELVPITDNLSLYKNEQLGLSFFYPDYFINTQDVTYPMYLVSFSSDGQCDVLGGSVGNQVKGCILLNIWQQPSTYEYNLTSTKFFRSETIRFHNATGTLKSYSSLGATVTTVQIPRYDTDGTASELVIQFSYEDTNYNANSVIDTVLATLEVEQESAVALQLPCCEGEIPTIWVQNRERAYLFKQGVVHPVLSDMKERFSQEAFSPDGSMIAFIHSDYDRDSVGLYRRPKSGISILSVKDPHNLTELISPGVIAHSNITWSPGGRYLSYVLGDGEGVGMIDVSTKEELFRYIADEYVYGLEKEPSRVTWLNDYEISLVFNGYMYIGTVDTPIKKLIASGINGTPLWSPDQKFVMYLTKESAVIQDIAKGDRYYFGEQAESISMGYSFVDVHAVGWAIDNTLLFTNSNGLSSAKIESGVLKLKTLPEITIEHGNYTLMNERLIIVSTGHPINSSALYDLERGVDVCPDLNFGKFQAYTVSDEGAFIVTNPQVPQWKRWPNNYDVATDQVERILEIYNVDSCQLVGSFATGNLRSEIYINNVQMSSG
jgi:hypothetical protein